MSLFTQNLISIIAIRKNVFGILFFFFFLIKCEFIPKNGTLVEFTRARISRKLQMAQKKGKNHIGTKVELCSENYSYWNHRERSPWQRPWESRARRVSRICLSRDLNKTEGG